jgi:hypothetical protein
LRRMRRYQCSAKIKLRRLEFLWRRSSKDWFLRKPRELPTQRHTATERESEEVGEIEMTY